MSDNSEYGLVMPFVNVTSCGGKFDDDSFTAGYEMGAFGQRCSLAAATNLLPFAMTIRRDNRNQADLIAMQAGLVTTEIEMDADEHIRAEWCYLGVSWPQQPETPEQLL